MTQNDYQNYRMRQKHNILYELQNIKKTYSNTHSPSLEINRLIIPRNKVVVILGYSGSGKSTLLNLLGFLDTPDNNHGSRLNFYPDTKSAPVDILDQPSSLKQKKSKYFGYIFQEGYLLKNFDANENTNIPLYINGIDPRNIKSAKLKIFKMLKLDKLMRELPDRLSGGEQQRVAIARSMMHSPKVILADEPSSNLDPTIGFHIMNHLKNWCVSEDIHDRTLIWVTHNIEQAAQLGEYFIILRGGKVVDQFEKPFNHDLTPNTLLEKMKGCDSKNYSICRFNDIPLLPNKNKFSHWNFILKFAIWDLFPKHFGYRKKTESNSDEFLPKNENLNSLNKYFPFGLSQKLNILTLFLVLLLSLVFANINLTLRNYLIWSASDPRINHVNIQHKDGIVTEENRKQLDSLKWVRKKKEGKDIFLADKNHTKTLNHTIIRDAVIGAFGQRDWNLHCYANANSASMRNNVPAPRMDISTVVLHVDDPILENLYLYEGDSFNTLKRTEKKIKSLFRGDKGIANSSKTGIIATITALKKDLRFKKIPQEINIVLGNEKIALPLLGITDWLPPGYSRLMISQSQFETIYRTTNHSDPLPGYQRVTLYFKDIIQDGLPLAEALQKSDYHVLNDISSQYAWIKNLLRFTKIITTIAFASIGILLLIVIFISYSQAIMKKQKQIAVLIASGIHQWKLYAIFMVEILIVWSLASLLAWLSYCGIKQFAKPKLLILFKLKEEMDYLLDIPINIVTTICTGTMILALLSVGFAVWLMLRRNVAEMLRTSH